MKKRRSTNTLLTGIIAKQSSGDSAPKPATQYPKFSVDPIPQQPHWFVITSITRLNHTPLSLSGAKWGNLGAL